MLRSKGHHSRDRWQRDENASHASFSNTDRTDMAFNKSIFGPYPLSKMLSWMQIVASGGCLSTEGDCDMQNQILSLRKFITLVGSKSPQRKRKLNIFLKQELYSPENTSNIKSVKSKMCREMSLPISTASCLMNSSSCSQGIYHLSIKSSRSSMSSLTSEDYFHGKESSFCSFANKKYLDEPKEDILHALESIESATGSKVSSLARNRGPICLPILDFNESMQESSISNSNEEMDDYLKKPRRRTRSQTFVGDSIPTMVVPVGSRFQANVPEWSGPAFRSTIYQDANDSELKWLGTKIWPVKDQLRETRRQRIIGRGRSDPCSCRSRGSKDCTNRHILEQKRSLKAALGPAFFSWKFDEMGEEVTKNWTSSEQEKFKSLMKSGSNQHQSEFWKRALKWFPLKSRENIISFYFNVFIPREMINAGVDVSEDAASRSKDTLEKGKHGKG